MGVSSAPQYTNLSDLCNDVQKIVDSYRKEVLGGIEAGADECAKVFIDEVKKVSPYDADNTKTPHYKDSWKIKPMRRAKYVRYVGNTKRVKGKDKSGKATLIPLINILEFSTDAHKHQPHVGTAVNNSKGQIISIITSKIQKGGTNA